MFSNLSELIEIVLKRKGCIEDRRRNGIGWFNRLCFCDFRRWNWRRLWIWFGDWFNWIFLGRNEFLMSIDIDGWPEFIQFCWELLIMRLIDKESNSQSSTSNQQQDEEAFYATNNIWDEKDTKIALNFHLVRFFSMMIWQGLCFWSWFLSSTTDREWNWVFKYFIVQYKIEHRIIIVFSDVVICRVSSFEPSPLHLTIESGIIRDNEGGNEHLKKEGFEYPFSLLILYRCGNR